MLTRVKRNNEKGSKTANLFTNLMKVDKRRRLDFGYIHIRVVLNIESLKI